MKTKLMLGVLLLATVLGVVVLAQLQAEDDTRTPLILRSATGDLDPDLRYATYAQGASADSAYAAAVTNATNANTASRIVKRDSSGNFSAGTITATLTGDVTGNVTGNTSGTAANVTGTVAIANGGTGATTAAGARTALALAPLDAGTDTGRLAYWTGAKWQQLGSGTIHQVLASGGAGALPTWTTVDTATGLGL